MVGHDDDVVLDPHVTQQLGRAAASRSSRWAGMQSDLAIVDAVTNGFPQLQVEVLQTVEELRATAAEVVVVLSYKTQPSFAWYASFFEAMRALESRGATVYPSADFKETISSKARYTKALKAAGLPMCPTEFLERADCVADDGTLLPSRVNAHLETALTSLGLLLHDAPSAAAAAASAASPNPSFHLVTKPSNADGGFGVAFWEAAAQSASHSPAQPPGESAAADVSSAENDDVQRASTGATASPSPASVEGAATPATLGIGAVRCGDGVEPTPLLDSLRLGAMLNNGCDVTEGKSAGGEGGGEGGGGGGGGGGGEEKEESAFLHYLRTVGFVGSRPHVLLQPLVPTLAQNFEIKIYFLKRQPFYASLVYGKEQLMAKVARPSTDPALFAYLAPLLEESRRALDALPADGPHDPKILMRVDWGTGEPLRPVPTALPASEAEAKAGSEEATREEDEAGNSGGGGGGGGGGGAGSSGGSGGSGSSGSNFLKRALVKRAGSLSAPQKKLKRSMEAHTQAPLAGPQRHFINEVEIHPGYYVDWDPTPDETIAPLAEAYGEYITRLLTERRAAEAL